MKPGRIIFALILIAAGVVLLLVNLNILSLHILTQWPLVPILIGFGMWMGYLDNRRDWGLVIPGTILLCVGILFYCCTTMGWRIMSSWWPVFILAPGLGFFAAYLASGRYFGLLIPACILTGIGLLLLLQIHLNNYALVLPAMFIAAGLVVLISAMRRGQERHDQQP